MADGSNKPLNKSRLEDLSDGIFAFAMTLLVLNIGIPAVQSISINDENARMVFISLLPSIVHYIVAFLTIAVFWTSHHRIYDRVRMVDSNLLWLNLACLMLIVLLPFSIEFVDTFNSVPTSALVFETNILLAWVFFFLQAAYVSKHPELLEKDAKIALGGKFRSFVMPVLTIIAMTVALMGYGWSTSLYLLIPIAYRLT